jgi:hypothetical protein
MCTQEVTGLMEKPSVTVFDEKGAQLEVSYDETTQTFTARTEVNSMSDDQKTVALEAAKINCLWMIEEVSDRGKIAKYFDSSSKPYKDITTMGELWMQGHAGYTFKNEEVTKFASYGGEMFSVYVSLDLDVNRNDRRSAFQTIIDRNKIGCLRLTQRDAVFSNHRNSRHISRTDNARNDCGRKNW